MEKKASLTADETVIDTLDRHARRCCGKGVMSKAPYKLLDLFSGIGGFSLGLERSGAFKTVAFCEIEDYPRRVLKKHWPEVPIYEDVRTLTAGKLAADGIAIDAICGGFPCQDISTAGRGAGLAGERSGLWSEYARLIGELRPSYVIVENVAALLGRGLERVLGDLASLGYDAEWHCIPASAIGAPHRRDRIWIIANPHAVRELQSQGGQRDERQWADHSATKIVSHADGSRLQVGQLLSRISLSAGRDEHGEDITLDAWWAVEPGLVRVVHGVPGRVGRIKALGNAVVPQIPELIGRAIAAARYQNFSTGTEPCSLLR